MIDDDGEVGDLSEVDPSLFKPAHEVLPRQLQETLGMRRRGPQKSPTKVATTIRIDADVLEALKATGRGWQTRANDLLRADIEAGRL
ncbi:BrnA antitoxin family protein [Xylophilus rhododendri]|uniref:BrnA antitoxin family protein n=1 Tax=Xylophilus rhododendri TaxID=2697032 RepID=UPI001E475AEF|nr:BrnA antitoxin family protein [Xylophilus rhododendri]